MSEYIVKTTNMPQHVMEVINAWCEVNAEIVRCIDCVWFKNSSYYGAYCTNFGSPLGDDYDGFCAWGERKAVVE